MKMARISKNTMEAARSEKDWIKQMVCFRLGQEEFGINILQVREIIRWKEMVQMPQTPASMAGVINLRGHVIPVIDLRTKLGLGKIIKDDKVRIIVVVVMEKLVGIIVDQVEQVIRLKKDIIDPPPNIGSVKIRDYIIGIAKKDDNLILVLNVDKIMSSEEIVRLEELSKLKTAVQSGQNDATSSEDRKKTGTVTEDKRIKMRDSTGDKPSPSSMKRAGKKRTKRQSSIKNKKRTTANKKIPKKEE